MDPIVEVVWRVQVLATHENHNHVHSDKEYFHWYSSKKTEGYNKKVSRNKQKNQAYPKVPLQWKPHMGTLHPLAHMKNKQEDWTWQVREYKWVKLVSKSTKWRWVWVVRVKQRQESGVTQTWPRNGPLTDLEGGWWLSKFQKLPNFLKFPFLDLESFFKKVLWDLKSFSPICKVLS